MNILLLRSNPRKSGFTQKLVDLFAKGVSENASLTDIDLTRKDLNPCKGCFNCWTATPGVCVQNDSMKELLENFLATDILVIASPLYAFAVSSYCKMFLERTLPLLAPGVVQNPNGVDRNFLRYPERGPKKMAALIVGGLKSSQHMTGVTASLKSYADGFGIEFAGALVRTESYILQFTDTKPKTIKNIETAFYQAGVSLSTDGIISSDIEEKAALQMASDNVYFERYSNIYWNYATEVSKRGGDLDEARVLTNRDIRLLMYEMARSVDPIACKGVRAVFQFTFPDKNSNFFISIDRGSNTIEERLHENPDITIQCDSTTWVSVILREAEALKLLTNGDIVLKGDKSLFRKLHRFFPPPNT